VLRSSSGGWEVVKKDTHELSVRGGRRKGVCQGGYEKPRPLLFVSFAWIQKPPKDWKKKRKEGRYVEKVDRARSFVRKRGDHLDKDAFEIEDLKEGGGSGKKVTSFGSKKNVKKNGGDRVALRTGLQKKKGIFFRTASSPPDRKKTSAQHGPRGGRSVVIVTQGNKGGEEKM